MTGFRVVIEHWQGGFRQTWERSDADVVDGDASDHLGQMLAEGLAAVACYEAPDLEVVIASMLEQPAQRRKPPERR